MKITYVLKKNQRFLIPYQLLRSALTIVSPTLNTKFSYRVSKGKNLNLKNPKTLDEKISWLKLNSYNKDELISNCADKYKVREYVESQGCGEILNELYGVYNNVEEIPWNQLPKKFVLKWNMGCGSNIICSNRNNLDINETIKKLKKWGKAKYYLTDSEMQYKYIKPKIVCEKFLETPEGTLPEDYKLYCFNGKASYVMICIGRENGHPKFYFFDRNWNLVRINKDSKEAPANFSVPKPVGIEKMFEYADNLSKPFPFVRADFYLINGKITFGELTFTPAGGTDSNRLPETDLFFGELLKLPNNI